MFGRFSKRDDVGLCGNRNDMLKLGTLGAKFVDIFSRRHLQILKVELGNELVQFLYTSGSLVFGMFTAALDCKGKLVQGCEQYAKTWCHQDVFFYGPLRQLTCHRALVADIVSIVSYLRVF